ncbi:MAG: putative membrane protein [Saprospiraceae bacterium]|jgi:putative membrane protein
MYVKTRYSIVRMLLWTRWESSFFILLPAAVVALHVFAGFHFLVVPWTPVALIGTAVAFIIGFQNSAAYGRIWEARKIWGGIVNTSRTWGMKTRDMVTNEHAKDPLPEEELKEHRETLVYRHIAWLTALRHAMRATRPWEVFSESKTNREAARNVHIPERISSLEDDLFLYLNPEESEYIQTKKNKPVALLYLQSKHILELKKLGVIWEFSFIELENLLEELLTLQGKSERIKNFPYPRQYATLSYCFVWIFIALLPFGLVPEFASIGNSIDGEFSTMIKDTFIWLSVPFCAVVSWVFHTMMRIGTVGENPFEGSANDVPISTISRGIEIDLRQMMDEEDDFIPLQFPEEDHVQM